MTTSPLTTHRASAAPRLLAAACLLAAPAIALAAGASTVRAQGVTPIPGDPVATQSGSVAGKLLPSGVRAYLGIPYAAQSAGCPPRRGTSFPRPQASLSHRCAARACPVD